MANYAGSTVGAQSKILLIVQKIPTFYNQILLNLFFLSASMWSMTELHRTCLKNYHSESADSVRGFTSPWTMFLKFQISDNFFYALLKI